MSNDRSDIIWQEDAERNGWVMPTAVWWKRLPVIRHFRAAYLRWRVERFASQWASCGIGLGHVAQYDAWVLYGIATGKERAPSPSTEGE